MDVAWVEVRDSEAVERFGYDLDRGELHVVFTGGRHYVYLEVEPETVMELITAESVGAFINLRIKPHYRYREVTRSRRGRPPARPADRRPHRQRQERPGPRTR